MQSILVLRLAHVREATCWHSLRSDDITLIVLRYRTTDSKNRHQEQVWPLFVKLAQIRQFFFGWCLIPFSPLSNSLKFPFFHFTLLDRNLSPFNFLQSDYNCKHSWSFLLCIISGFSTQTVLHVIIADLLRTAFTVDHFSRSYDGKCSWV